MLHVILNERLYPAIARINIHGNRVVTALFGCCLAGATCRNAAVSAHVLCTPFNHALVYSIISIKATYVCLAVTCHMHFWQNGRYLVCATAVKQGWNGYRNKGQHSMLYPEEENSPAAPAGTRTRDLSITSLTL